MKLILTADVANLGAPGDIVEVKDGYGRNYLLPARAGDRRHPGRREAGRRHPAGAGGPRRSATWTTPRRSRASSRPAHRPVTAKAAGDSGRLFGSVTAADIVAAVKAAGGPALDKRAIELPGHIKTTGKHAVGCACTPSVATSSWTIDGRRELTLHEGPRTRRRVRALFVPRACTGEVPHSRRDERR